MNIIDLAKELLYILLTGCGVAVAGALINYINQKIDEVQSDTKLVEYENLNKHVDDAQDIIVKIVKAVSQTYVNKLKEAGKFTDEAQQSAKRQAMSIATALISSKGKEAIEQLHGNFQNYLDTVIESTVLDNKNAKNKDTKGE